MNSTILGRYNEVVKPGDQVFILGDLILGQHEDESLEIIKALPGDKIIIRGNHDTDRRIELYKDCGWPVFDALYLKYKKYHFYLSHFPTLTGNLEKESLQQCTLNLFGHTHAQTPFFYDLPYLYNIGLDAHDCYPVCIDKVIHEMEKKAKECREML